MTTRAPNWQVETAYELLLWDDIVHADRSGPLGRRVTRSLAAFADVVATGTFFRYCVANWQYALFFLFPYVILLLFAVVAVAAVLWLARLLTVSHAAQLLAVVLASPPLFVLMLQSLGRRWSVQQAMDDWIFSWQYLLRRRPDIDRRIDAFADALLARARDRAIDEIVVVGHSMGATLAIETLARALRRDRDLGRHGATVCLLTVGSTVAKFTLHPAGLRIRRDAVAIIDEPSIAWAEYHARSDAISFYKFNPIKLKRFYGDRVEGKPLIRRVRIQDMLTKRTYWRIRSRFMRVHYQFLMANERRSTYDYFMMVCGPVPFANITIAPIGPAELIAPDGSLRDPSAAMADMPMPDDFDYGLQSA